MINFSVHQVRGDASKDFEQMLALLVDAVHGEANLILANPGDWGIDVFVGDLNGRVTIWQAKYFVREFGGSQQGQIRDSFASALKAAGKNGYTVDRWILCIPSSMDGPMTKWWQQWSAAKQLQTGVTIDLWQETELRQLLLRPEAQHVRRHYYNPYREDSAADGPVTSLPGPPADTEPEPTWAGGAELDLAGSVYLLHDAPSQRTSRDMSWIWREATADLIEPGTGRTRIRQVQIVRRIAAAEQQHAGLGAQARLLTRMNGQAGLPRVIEIASQTDRVTVVTSHPIGSPWADVFGPGPRAADRFTAVRVLAAAAYLCTSLGALHARGTSHRALHPAAIVVDGARCLLRDAGLAEVPPAVGEGEATYRAPEQSRALGTVGPQADIYQLAAIVYHTLTSHPPAPAGSPPIRTALPGFPEQADRILLCALDADPAMRPAGASALASALIAARAEMAR